MPNSSFRDSSGELVREGRRKLSDRRLSGIQAEWLEIIVERGRVGAPFSTQRNLQAGE
jgi:hypothetical protein